MIFGKLAVMREEKDSIGKVLLNDEAVYGIHSFRGRNNFPGSGERVNPWLIMGVLLVKKAAASVNCRYGFLSECVFNSVDSSIDLLLDETDKFIMEDDPSIYAKVIVDPYQGGAGTSLNMNVNEVIANTALKISGNAYGRYDIIHPIDDINKHQSTNDVVPTAFKIASIYLMRQLANEYASLQRTLQEKENQFSNVIKLGRTQMQDAVPITLGGEFGAYAQAVARDRWRLYNGEERLRSVNLGGTAAGNSVSAPLDYSLNVIPELKRITGLPLAKGEDLIDITQNLDVFVEVHGLIKSGAVSLIKICNDLRFLSSGPFGGIGEISLPAVQAGSSIMPGKVNPVIPEHTIQICELVKGNDTVISNLVGAGNLELNPFIPAIAHLFLKSTRLLKDAVKNFNDKCIKGIEADRQQCLKNLLSSSASAAVLISLFGYDEVSEIVQRSVLNKVSFVEQLKKEKSAGEEDIIKMIYKEMGIIN